MPDLSPKTIREINKLAVEMGNKFAPPEFIPGCEVMSISDKDAYDTDNGWIEAICGQHNQQRCRWKGKYSNVQVGDYVDVLYFKSVKLFEVFGKGGDGDIGGSPLTTKGDLLGYSTLVDRIPVSGNDGYVLTEDSTDPFGIGWQPAAGGGGVWPDADKVKIDGSATEYTTIVAAVAAASDGDTIRVGIGTFAESAISAGAKSLTIIGSDNRKCTLTHTATVHLSSFITCDAGYNITLVNIGIELLVSGAVTATAIYSTTGTITQDRVRLVITNDNTGGEARGVVNSGNVHLWDCDMSAPALAGTTTINLLYSFSGNYYIYGGKYSATVATNARVAYGSTTFYAYGMPVLVAGTLVAGSSGVWETAAGNISALGTLAVAGAVTASSTLAVTGDITATAGDIIQSSTSKDIFPKGRSAGVQQRLESWFSPTGYINSVLWTWATDAPFDGTPSTVDTTTYPDLVNIHDNTVNDDHFFYMSVSPTAGTGIVNFYCRVAQLYNSYVGIRVDSGSDTSYFQIKIVDSATAGLKRLEISYRNGGAVTTVYANDPMPPAFLILRIQYFMSGVGSAYATFNTPIPVYNGVTQSAAWTPARAGIIFGQRNFAGIDRSGLFGEYKVSVT